MVRQCMDGSRYSLEHKVQMFVVSLQVFTEEIWHGWHEEGATWQKHSCHCRHRSDSLVRQLHHIDIVAFAAKALHVRSPPEYSEIECCDEARDLPVRV